MTRRAHRTLTAVKAYGASPRFIAPTTDTCSDDGTIDWIAVERAAAGDYNPTLLTNDERWAATQLLSAAGYGEPAIADLLATNKRQIHRWRHAAVSPSKRTRPAQQKSPCGTTGAYRRHLRYGEPPCEPCRDADRDYRNRLKQQRLAEAA